MFLRYTDASSQYSCLAYSAQHTSPLQKTQMCGGENVLWGKDIPSRLAKHGCWKVIIYMGAPCVQQPCCGVPGAGAVAAGARQCRACSDTGRSRVEAQPQDRRSRLCQDLPAERRCPHGFVQHLTPALELYKATSSYIVRID